MLLMGFVEHTLGKFEEAEKVTSAGQNTTANVCYITFCTLYSGFSIVSGTHIGDCNYIITVVVVAKKSSLCWAPQFVV